MPKFLVFCLIQGRKLMFKYGKLIKKQNRIQTENLGNTPSTSIGGKQRNNRNTRLQQKQTLIHIEMKSDKNCRFPDLI